MAVTNGRCCHLTTEPYNRSHYSHSPIAFITRRSARSTKRIRAYFDPDKTGWRRIEAARKQPLCAAPLTIVG